MANIECRYYWPKCDYYLLGADCDHPNADGFVDDCEYYEKDPSDKCLNPRCKYRHWEEIAFEKTTKSYRLDSSGLEVGREYIPRDYIEYLRIGNREEITESEGK